MMSGAFAKAAKSDALTLGYARALLEMAEVEMSRIALVARAYRSDKEMGDKLAEELGVDLERKA